MKAWTALKVDNVNKDIGVVKHMWWREYYRWEKQVKTSDAPPEEQFCDFLAKKPSQLMLAVTAPRCVQREAWKGLMAAGFKPLAIGLRTPGHTRGKYVYLWGKLSKCRARRPLKRQLIPFDFACCGARGELHGLIDKTTPASWGLLTIHRVPTLSKFNIPKDFALVAKTKYASYFVENFEKVYRTL